MTHLENAFNFVFIAILLFFHFQGTYLFADEATVTLSTEHFYRAWENNDNPAVWTFNSTIYFTIRFHFTDFYCYYDSSDCYVRIGNGLVVSGQSRLLSHSGRNAPRDVTSASNTAWLEVWHRMHSEICP